MAIKVVTIDFWNTIFDSSNGEVRREARRLAVRKEVERMGHLADDELLGQCYRDSMDYFNTVWRSEQRTPLTRSMVEYLWQRTGIEPDEAAIETLTREFCDGVLVSPPALLPGAKEALEKLASKYYLALISDTAFSPGSVLMQLMEREGILRYFSDFSFSDETGVAKPHPLAFERAIRNAAAEPAECVHVGDIEATDVLGAKNFGMKAIRFLGDNNPHVGNGHDEQTAADAEAVSWDEVVQKIEELAAE